jgi:hypothetical protein
MSLKNDHLSDKSSNRHFDVSPKKLYIPKKEKEKDPSGENLETGAT